MTDIHAASNTAIAKAMASSEVVKTASTNGILNSKRVAHFIDAKTVTRRIGWNPRFDFGEIDGLATSLAANGMLNPIRVKRIPLTDAGALFELIDGDRRFTAVEQLIKKGKYSDVFPDGIPAIIVDKAQDDLTSLVQMFEANSGKQFLPLEEAAAYQRMQDAGLTIKQICASVGRAQVHVSEMLSLLKADASVTDAVKSGDIGKTMAKQIAKVAKGDKAKQAELVAQAKAVGNDKGKRRAVLKAVDNAKVAKAKSKGKTLKIRALDDAELSAIGAKVASKLSDMLKDAGIELDADLHTWLKGQKATVQIAYTFGALEALKVAAGQPNNLTAD